MIVRRLSAMLLALTLGASSAFALACGEDREGLIVNILDQRVWRPDPEFFSYSISKAALWDATRMLAQALAPRIRVNGVGPGPTLQSIHQDAADFQAEAAATIGGRRTNRAVPTASRAPIASSQARVGSE